MSSKRISLTVVGFGAVTASLIGMSLLGAGVAFADSPSDERAEFVDDPQPPTCAELGLVDVTEQVDATFSEADGNANAQIDITAVDAGVVVDTIIVKGGSAYNVYEPGERGLGVSPPYNDLISPLNNGGNIPTVSIFRVCGTVTTTTTTTPPPTTSSTTSTTTPASTTTTAASTTTTASSSTTSSSSTAPETTTTTPATSTTAPATSTTTGDSTTTTTGGSTTTTGESTTTTTGGSSTTTGGSSTVVPPPISTMPNTGAGDSSNLIGAALLALMAGALALLLARRSAA